jgi:molybdate transport system substrate-binding protein
MVPLFLLLATAPDARAADSSVAVLAASSLTESLQAVGTAWTAKGHPEIAFSFDSSSRLAKQIEAGSPTDVFFSADVEWMDELARKGWIDESTRADLVGNELVVVVAAGKGSTIGSAKDLARVQHLALGGESVPAGKYARAALTSLHAWEPVKDRVVNGDNARAVLAWVANGEAEAGIVYATDARVEPKVVVAFTLPSSSHPPIVYPAAVVKNAKHADEARAFVAFCRSTEALAIFEAAGFRRIAPQSPAR